MTDRRPRFTRITGMLSGVQQDEADLGEPDDSVVDWFPRFGMPRVDPGTSGAPSTFDPDSDWLSEPFPEELL